MVKVTINYEGALRCAVAHQPSGQILQTDAPLDNGGKGASFSPTDLCAAALGSCIATIVGLELQKSNIDPTAMRIEVSKTMSANLPRRIVRLETQVWLPLELTDEQQWQVELAARNCPVRHSLSAEIETPIIFNWQATTI